MLYMSLIFTINISLSLLLNSLASIICFKSNENQEKLSPFECGFEPIKSSRLPFSLRFFLIAIIFLIFDVEIVFILPMIMNLKKSKFISWTFSTIMFIMILITGIVHEWNQSMLEWN